MDNIPKIKKNISNTGFTCNKCGIKFFTERILQAHRERHESVTPGNESMRRLHVRVPPVYIEKLNDAVEAGYYKNRSEAVRQAIRGELGIEYSI